VKDLIQLQSIYKKMDKDIEQLSFEQGDGERINRIWYYIPNEAELQKIQTDLQNHLQK